MTDLEHSLLRELDTAWRLLKDCDEEREQLRAKITTLLAQLTATEQEDQ
jgi:hypothetical protein